MLAGKLTKILVKLLIQTNIFVDKKNYYKHPTKKINHDRHVLINSNSHMQKTKNSFRDVDRKYSN